MQFGARRETFFKTFVWLGLSVALSLAMASVALHEGVGTYVVQDDARQHVFWMQRFLDAELFPNDLIANYFQSVAPVGYTTLYRAATAIGLEPFTFNKLLPPILAVITTAFGFGATLQLFPVPFAGFGATSILNLSLWMKDDLVSGTPRAFVYPLLTAFLYFLLRRDIWMTALSIVATGLFYPQYVLVETGVLVLNGVGFPKFRFDRTSIFFALVGCIVAALVLLPFLLATNEFGPVVTLAQAKESADFHPKGRSAFFNPDPLYFWMGGDRSGFFPGRTPLALWIGVLLPVWRLFPKVFPLVTRLRRSEVLLQLLVSASAWFLLAHLFLFKLHLPSRYSHHSLRVLLSIASGIALAVLVDAIWRRAVKGNIVLKGLGGAIALSLVLSVVASPLWLHDAFKTAYNEGYATGLYEFFKTTPKDSSIAGIDEELNNIPTFSQRSILTGLEYAIPYHTGYYSQLKQRTIDLIRAQYSSDPKLVWDFLREYDIDYWVVDRNDFSISYLKGNYWLDKIRKSQLSEDPLVRSISETFQNLESGEVPVLSQWVDRCSIFEFDRFIVLETRCLLEDDLTAESAPRP